MQATHDDTDCRVVPRKQYVRLNESTRARIDTTVKIGTGSFKEVYQGIYDSGPNEGERCVIKLMRDCRDNDALMMRHFDIELSIVAEAQKHVNKFNAEGIIDRKIWLHKPEVWTFDEDCDPEWAGKKCLCEPLLPSFVRFNSNTGWAPDDDTEWPEVMQALSHFSYYKSGGDAVLCDLQGGAYGRDIALTDPIVMTRSHSFGATDLGAKGLEAFFSHHVCNKYCRKEWHRPRNRTTDIPIKIGSSMRSSEGELMHDALTPAGGGGIYVGPGLPTIKEDPSGSVGSPAPVPPPARRYVPRRPPGWWLHKKPKTPMTPESVTPRSDILGKRQASDDKDWATACKRVTLQVRPGLNVPLQQVPMMNPAAVLQPCGKQ